MSTQPSRTDPHPSTAHLAVADATALAADLAAGRTTSTDLVAALLDRIRVVDGPGEVALASVLATAPDALEQAARLDAERAAGRVRGPLHGLPVLVKDNIEAVGLPATAGSLALAGRTVVRDAPLVAALREAGLVVLGATNLSEWANLRSPGSTSGWSAVGGLTGNPWALERSAGGSSSGSGAAVAAGLAPLAIGTETDGSIVCPASLNGCVGLKPTVGLVPTTHVVPLSPSQDSPGPMARSVADAALLLDALTGSDAYGGAPGTVDAATLQLGVAGAWLTGHDATDELFTRSLQQLEESGVLLTPLDLPSAEAEVELAELHVLLCETRDALDAYLAARPGEGVRSLSDVVDFDVEHADEELAHFGQEFFEQALATEGVADEGYAEDRARCLAWARDAALVPALSSPDGPRVLVAPAYPPAWKSDLVLADHLVGGSAAITAAAMAGAPVLCVPMGLVGGLPVGLLLVALPGDDAHLLAVGHAVEQALGVRADGAWAPTYRRPARG